MSQKTTISQKAEKLMENQPAGIQHVIFTGGQIAEKSGLSQDVFYSAIRGISQNKEKTLIFVDIFNQNAIVVDEILNKAIAVEHKCAENDIYTASNPEGSGMFLSRLLREGCTKRNLLNSTEVVVN
ncbi:MAG: hypothetical protein KGH71_01975 [Candidatus Micrarchaeota archaeon]|nr:hypothetical protein [Candidatus Micrarchaeota archaeon]